MELKKLIWDAVEKIDSFWDIKEEALDKLDELDKKLYEAQRKLMELHEAMQKKEEEEKIK